jgi:hypothetical protein
MLRLLALLIPLIVPMVLLALTSPRDGAPPRADNKGADRAPASDPTARQAGASGQPMTAPLKGRHDRPGPRGLHPST